MKRFLLIAFTLGLYSTYAQSPEDILKYSYTPQSGTARNLSIGGAMGSLGGDINALYVNPAGLAFYRTNEWAVSPGFMLNSNKLSFRGTDSSNKRNAFNLGTSGVVLGYHEKGSKWANEAFGVAISQTANFRNLYTYKGYNNLSSATENYANEYFEANRTRGLSIDQALNDNNISLETKLSLYTYLTDTIRRDSNLLIVSRPELILQNNQALLQQRTVQTGGGVYEIALGYAANMDDKIMIGGSLGIPIVSYSRTTTYRESDTSSNTNNGFNYYEYKDYLNTSGIGLNLRLGVIYKPQEYIRLGLALHTPTWYFLTDKERAEMTTDSENGAGVQSVRSSEFTNNYEMKSEYTTTTPLRVIASGSYVFREIKDTRRQRAFITADVEYVNYSGSRYRASGENVTSDDKFYYAHLKDVIKSYYKSAFNYRVGGELKFNTIMFRLGGAYYSNPYKDSQLKSSIKQLSGGLGYRDKGMFIDLTYVHSWLTDVNFPYRLSDKPNTFAEQNTQRGNIMLTVGFKF